MMVGRHARRIHERSACHNDDRVVKFRKDDVHHARRGVAHGHGHPRWRHQASWSQDGGVDVEGKDSWKYAQAGANPVILSASDQYAIFVSTPQGEPSRDELVAKIADDVDLVIVEGFRAEADGAIEVYRNAAGHPDPKLASEERIALVTDNVALADQVRAEGKAPSSVLRTSKRSRAISSSSPVSIRALCSILQ